MNLRSLNLKAIEHLPPEDVDRALRLLREIDGDETLTNFICRVSPHHPPPAHVAKVIEVLQGARRNRVKVCISMPPRHAKTHTILHAIPWWLQLSPADTCAYLSYSDRQAWSKSRLARALAARAGVQLAPDATNLAEWRTPSGGGLLSGGIGSGLTGQGVSGFSAVDDPFKNRVEADSEGNREKVWEWFNEVVMTRSEGASVIVLHTRWHEDDLIGRLSKDPEWKVINLPAISEEGEPLWPERYPLAELEALRRQIGEFSFAALFQGRPRPRGGAIFGEPRYYAPATTDLTGCRYVLAADPAASEKTSADYSAAGVLAIKGSGRDAIAYLVHAYRKQVAIPVFVEDLVSMQHRFGNTAINVESVGGFKAIPQMLRALNKNLRVREIIPVGDKFTRAQPAAAAWNEGRILVPSDSPPWLASFLDEVTKFTGVKDANDDQVDWLAHAWNSISKGSGKTIYDVL
jgi:predicted phage terminase large subunit-like protein